MKLKLSLFKVSKEFLAELSASWQRFIFLFKYSSPQDLEIVGLKGSETLISNNFLFKSLLIKGGHK